MRSQIQREIDKHQYPLTDIETGYMAGLIDGEGTITIIRVSRKNRTLLLPKVHVINTSRPLMEWASQKLFAPLHTRQPAKSGWATAYLASIQGNACYNLLRLIASHLVIKREQAQIVMRFIESRAHMPGYQMPYTDEQHALYERVKVLNQRGMPLE